MSSIASWLCAGDPDTGDTYYHHWLATLEGLVARKGVASSETLHRYRDAWTTWPTADQIELTVSLFRPRRPKPTLRHADFPAGDTP